MIMLRYILVCLLVLVNASLADKMLVYFGTYTGGESSSEGIYASRLDMQTGTLEEPFLVAETGNPSFLEIHPSGKFLYAVSEAWGSGGLIAYLIDDETGDLIFLNRQTSQGRGPCHLSLDHQGKNLLVANYSSGSAGVTPLQRDGLLSKPTGFAQHTGSSINPDRQKEPHAHSINVSPDDRFAFVADLGIDKIMIYELDIIKGTISPNEPAFVQLEPGAGPRHFSFHPNGQYAYVINELNGTMTAFSYNMEKGALSSIQTISTLPENFTAYNKCAEVRVHPSGKFLYGSNRGHNSIVCYRINPSTGLLSFTGFTMEGIDTPRNFNIDPTGTYCLVANQGNNTVNVFKVNQKNGNLTPTGSVVKIDKPVCVRFLKIAD
jgi:6-phosphogluconolactonase